MASAELTSTQATYPHGQHIVADRPANFEALVHSEASGREASAQPPADRRRGPAAIHAVARWLRRTLADSAQAWALAAGVPPDLYHPEGVAGDLFFPR